MKVNKEQSAQILSAKSITNQENADLATQSVAMPVLQNKLVHGEKRAKSKEVEKHRSTLEKLEAKYEAEVKMTLRNGYKAIKEKTVELQERLTKVQKKSSELQEDYKKLQAKIESSTEILHAHSMESKKHDSRYLLSDKKDLQRKRATWQSKSKKLKNTLKELESESLKLEGRIEENNILLKSLSEKEQEIKSIWNKIIEFIITKVKSLLPGHSDKNDLAKKESQNSKGIEAGNPPSYEEAMKGDRLELEALEVLRAWSRSEVEPTSGPIHNNRVTYPKLDLDNTFTNEALSGNMKKVKSEHIAKNLSLTPFSEVKSGTPVVNALPKVSIGDTKSTTSSATYKTAGSTFAPSVTEQELAEPNLSALKAERTKQWVADPVALQSSKVAANLSSIPSLEVKRDTLYVGPQTSYVVTSTEVSMDDTESTTFTYVTEESTATSSVTEQESNYENIDDGVSSVESDTDTVANILSLYKQAEMEYELENPDAYIRAESIDSEISLPEKRKQYTETMAMEPTITRPSALQSAALPLVSAPRQGPAAAENPHIAIGSQETISRPLGKLIGRVTDPLPKLPNNDSTILTLQPNAEGTTSSPAALLNMQQTAALHGQIVKRCDKLLNNELPNSSMDSTDTEHSSSQLKHEALNTEVKSPIFSRP